MDDRLRFFRIMMALETPENWMLVAKTSVATAENLLTKGTNLRSSAIPNTGLAELLNFSKVSESLMQEAVFIARPVAAIPKPPRKSDHLRRERLVALTKTHSREISTASSFFNLEIREARFS